MASFTTKTEDYRLLSFRGHPSITMVISGVVTGGGDPPPTTGQLWPRGNW